MAFSPTDDTIWWTMMACTLFFTVLGTWFPVKSGQGQKLMPGVIWAHVRALVFPFFASVSWYIMAAFDVAATNSGTHILYYYFFMFFLVYLFVFFPMAVYFAFHPLMEVLEGREKLENG